jgi:hypothetical protein
MATEYERVDLPTGYDFAIKTSADVDYVDLGPTAADASLEFTYDTIKATASKAQKIKTFYKNMQVSLTASFYQQYLEKINKLMGGAGEYSTVAATPVVVDDEDYLAGAWALETFIPFVNQNAAGTVPASISVANAGALTLDTDYLIIQAGSQWGVYILDTASTDIAETLEINYTYTPAAKEIIKVGSSSVDITAYEVRLRKPIEGTDKYQTMYIYSAANEGGFTFGFPRYDVDDVPFQEINLVGTVDTSRTDMDQLFRIERDI